MENNYFFIDTETTGLDPEWCEVWEIAIIEADGTEHHWQNRISLRAKVDPWVLENTRFGTDYDKFSALSVGETALKLIELTEGKHMIGACPWFDSERLHKLIRYNNIDWYPRPDHPWHYHLIDVETLMLQHYMLVNKKLTTLPWKSRDLAYEVGAPVQDESTIHTALADARWARDVFNWCVDDVS